MITRRWSIKAASLGLVLALPGLAAAQVVVVPGTATTWQPVVETRLRTEPVVTIGAQPRIGYRPAAQLTSVPVTTFHNVTVDEGHYQTVWVPRPVTRSVAQTTWQPQVSYRSVPYVYAEPVAQLSTRLVGEQTVRYVPQTQLVGVPLNVSSTWMSLPAAAQPAMAVTSSLPMDAAAETGTPIPDPAFAKSGSDASGFQWTMVGPRAVEGPIAAVSLSNGREYEVLPAMSLTPGESVRAPSAAIVWQTPGRRP
jgi:hypothetical protein